MDQETKICIECEQPRKLDQFREGTDSTVCGPCRYGSLVLGLPKDHPTKTPSKTPPRTPNNALNRAIATEKRGPFEIPIVKPNLAEIPIKEYRENRRTYDEARRKRDSVPPPDWARK